MKRRRPRPARPYFVADIETDPFRADWLRLTPGQRIVRSWRMRRMIRDPQAAHDPPRVGGFLAAARRAERMPTPWGPLPVVAIEDLV